MEKSPEAFRTISEVSDWLDTPAHVLRFWESRFSQVKPVKRAGGRRYYRPGDMLLLGGIKKLLHEDGMTIRGVQKILREQGVRHVSAMSMPLDGGPVIEAEADEAPMAENVEPEAETEDNVVVLKAGKTEREAAPAAEETPPAAPEPEPEADKAPEAAPQPPAEAPKHGPGERWWPPRPFGIDLPLFDPEDDDADHAPAGLPALTLLRRPAARAALVALPADRLAELGDRLAALHARLARDAEDDKG